MLHLLVSEEQVIRDLAANIVPKIVQADWPNDWPGFLEELACIIDQTGEAKQVISVLKVLRGVPTKISADVEFISETLTDDSYFSIVPPIVERLLAMQEHPSLLVRAKAQSVFRACIEQMEMYKDTSAYQATVKSFVDVTIGPWMTSLNHSLAVNVTTLSGDDFVAAVKLKHATYKVRL
jgi:hypothetical protein